MNNSAIEFFKNNFKDSILLSEKKIDFDNVLLEVESLPRGWYELSRLNKEDRINFSRDYVLKNLPYIPHIYSFVFNFFDSLDDVDVILTKNNDEEFYTPQIVYSKKKSDVFFRGFIPADEELIDQIDMHFNNMLPFDFVSFLKIHNGFCKNDDTGIFKIEDFDSVYDNFLKIVESKDSSIKLGSKFIDPNSLIPFYQCYNKDEFQCFNIEWFPKNQTANVYYTGSDNSISDYLTNFSWHENFAFETFLDWLIFYLDVESL